MIRFVFSTLAVLVLCSSCFFSGDKEHPGADDIVGNWLIVYPDHKGLSDKQRKLYEVMQDSLLGLMGLKTVSFFKDGTFRQTDSLFAAPGRWEVTEEGRLLISGGGLGLDPFEGWLMTLKKNTLQVSERVAGKGGRFSLVWNLKRIDKDPGEKLFQEEANWWRKTPGASEDEAALKKRVRAVLNYYSLYYKVVSEEANYFSPSRVSLPFKYYRSGVGLSSFNLKNNFNRFFYDSTQKRQAHRIISKGMDELSKGKYPTGKNYVAEYAMFMEQLADVIE